MKKLIGIRGNDQGHWVGDGFPVRTLFFYQDLGKQMSPFLILDYAGPAEFPSTTERKGVGSHPHRGFETVTIVYEGEVAHKDSTGQGGVIGAGDVQWMTAGSGILHEEFHSESFARSGGTLEMVQLWVNLPAQLKMTKPAYQAILDKQIPVTDLSNGAGQARIIAGEFYGHTGPASTFTPLNVIDLKLKRGSASIPVSEGWNASLVVLKGAVEAGEGVVAKDAQMLMFSNQGQDIQFNVLEDSIALLLSGEPINEPIVGYGPFVMNTKEEIAQAMQDFNSGSFGRIA
ncbi:MULTISPECIES: pirin family protein [unclassified Polynucleobacter]|uniref:pirin family protein n=1 Tax=unclassified Polynucleobacter TaxID=2640945 RepID=UPI0008C66FAD|nr:MULTISPECIES: pirin family protein [unclassified Polynucleobacter]OHC11012.1 MAG: quercetin 2,3-dioxygenase [Polynucleobacter sp. GWA2_45_21]HBK44562.1 quercetin 2,3-dioxygenase [Polynucleobacter sp.]